MHKETSEWVAQEMVGVKFEEKGNQYGCIGIGWGAR